MKKDEKKLPFFAKLLEKQVATENVKGGAEDTTLIGGEKKGNPTMKWPSDGDDPMPIP